MPSTSLSLFLKSLLLFLILSALSACATVKKPLTGIVAGREVETLQSSISVSVKSGEHTTSGRGYLIYKSPDRFHLALLSPFGLTVFEVFIDGEDITCLVPSKQMAYRGRFSQLPDNSPLQSMAIMKWVQVRPAPGTVPPGTKETTDPSGDHYYFDENGLVDRKVSPDGDKVAYQDYSNLDGVAFPESIVIGSRFGTVVKIIFDEPQINQPVEEAALKPVTEGYNVRPLTEFKGF
ncbi:MAG TPA: outer membrane lipoprotein LolB [Geomonas sp.]|nr:outer membrane lipoprotein LolB [Geomonas sp.]